MAHTGCAFLTATSKAGEIYGHAAHGNQSFTAFINDASTVRTWFEKPPALEQSLRHMGFEDFRSRFEGAGKVLPRQPPDQERRPIFPVSEGSATLRRHGDEKT